MFVTSTPTILHSFESSIQIEILALEIEHLINEERIYISTKYRMNDMTCCVELKKTAGKTQYSLSAWPYILDASFTYKEESSTAASCTPGQYPTAHIKAQTRRVVGAPAPISKQSGSFAQMQISIRNECEGVHFHELFQSLKQFANKLASDIQDL